MARRVFFSFHYERDIWRANVVRNSWVCQEDREAAGFWDASLWEETKLKGDAAIKRLIDGGLQNTSVTAVLIGAETADRRWVQYEIMESYKRKNGLLGVYIHNIKDARGVTDQEGTNPFDRIYITDPLTGRRKYFSEMYPTYYWYGNDGFKNFGTWVEDTARSAGRSLLAR